MIRTTRCRHCGLVLDAFVEFVPGLPLGHLSSRRPTADSRPAAARHAERCPGPAKSRQRDEPTTEASRTRAGPCEAAPADRRLGTATRGGCEPRVHTRGPEEAVSRFLRASFCALAHPARASRRDDRHIAI